MTSSVKASLPSRMYGLFPFEWTGLAETTLANFRTISLYILHYTVYYARITVTKMQYRVNSYWMAYTILKYGEKMQNIRKCNIRCAHTPQQMRPGVTKSPNMFKCQ